MFCDFPIAQLDYSFAAKQMTQWVFPFLHVETSPNVITAFQGQPDAARAAIPGDVLQYLGCFCWRRVRNSTPDHFARFRLAISAWRHSRRFA